MSERDAFEDLQQANPRHKPGFDAAIASISGRTKQTLAATSAAGATGRATGGAGTSGWSRFWAPPTGRGRKLLAGVIGASALLIVLVLMATGTIPRPGSDRSHLTRHASGEGPGATAGRSPGTGTTTPTTGASGAAPTTVAAPVPTTSSAAVPAASGVPPTIAKTRSQVGALAPPTTTRTTIPKAPTAATRPPTSVVPDTAPTCVVSPLSQPPAYQSVQVQDSGSGLASITNVAITNGSVQVPGFASGTKAPVLVVATKTDPTQATRWSFDATNVAGRTTHCV